MNKIAFCVLAGFVFGTAAFSQESETSVESEYMSTMDDLIIAELANSDERENKEVALQYLRNAAENGSVSPDMIVALEQLAGEGTNTQSRTRGRVMNNFPDIRREACIILGQVGTEDAAKKLNTIVKSDNEPMVLSAAFESLGEIGYNENDEVSNAIAFYMNHFETMSPNGNSSLALAAVNAYEKLAGNIKDTKPVLESLQRIATDYHYAAIVRKRARDVLNNMRSSDTKSDNKNKKK